MQSNLDVENLGESRRSNNLSDFHGCLRAHQHRLQSFVRMFVSRFLFEDENYAANYDWFGTAVRCRVARRKARDIAGRRRKREKDPERREDEEGPGGPITLEQSLLMSLWVVTVVCRGEERRATRNKREDERRNGKRMMEEKEVSWQGR